MTYRIRTVGRIPDAGLDAFPVGRYEVGPEVEDPHVVLVRSADLHSMLVPGSLLAVARAGIGVDNIPVTDLGLRGIPVFNAPGANANAVKELVVASLFLASRHITRAWDFARQLEGDHSEITAAVEIGKKQFVGVELAGRTLGVIGLGAIGVQVANAALALGMSVIGFDPGISVSRAWQLSSSVRQADSLDAVLMGSDMVTLHVPLTEQTSHLVDERRLGLMRKNSVLINFARARLVDEGAVLAALDSGQLSAYATDFPAPRLINHPRVTALPHLGASTVEAEANSVRMVAESVRDYLEDGVIRNSVNYPEAVLGRGSRTRLAVMNANVPGVVGSISTLLAEAGLNISDLLNVSDAERAYTLIDVESTIPEDTLAAIAATNGVQRVRVL